MKYSAKCVCWEADWSFLNEWSEEAQNVNADELEELIKRHTRSCSRKEWEGKDKYEFTWIELASHYTLTITVC